MNEAIENKNKPLEVCLRADIVTIEIGVQTLGIAIENAPFMEEGREGAKVVDPNELARCVVEELKNEDEQGTTMVHRLFDEAADSALENEPCGIEIPNADDSA